MEQVSTTIENTQTQNVTSGAQENVAKAGVSLINGEAILFSIINNHSASLNAQITDNYVESNFAIQDHIAFAPIIVTLSGFVGEQILKSEEATQQAQDELEQAKNRQRLSGDFFNLSNYIENRGEGLDLTTGFSSSMITTKLGVIGNIIPPLSNYTQMAVNAVSYIYSAGRSFLTNKWNNKNKAIVGTTGSSTIDEPNIPKAYEQLKNTFYARKPSRIYTPWAVYDNMYIQNIEISQDSLNHIVDISVTFKQLKFSKVEYSEVNEEVRNSYNAALVADEQNCGKANELESSLHKMGVKGNELVGKLF